MKRLDWTFIRPALPMAQAKDQAQKAARLELVEEGIAHFIREAKRRPLTEREVEELITYEELHADLTISPCAAVQAPRIGDDPEWQYRLIEEFEATETDLDLDEFLELRRQDYDCERCPKATHYNLYPLDPCELSVGPLLDALYDATLLQRIQQAMGPEDMRALADQLDQAREQGDFRPLAALDIADLLHHAAAHLRFWAQLGFGIQPELSDEDALSIPEWTVPDAGSSSPLIH